MPTYRVQIERKTVNVDIIEIDVEADDRADAMTLAKYKARAKSSYQWTTSPGEEGPCAVANIEEITYPTVAEEQS